jgi:hypothetical protein
VGHQPQCLIQRCNPRALAALRTPSYPPPPADHSKQRMQRSRLEAFAPSRCLQRPQTGPSSRCWARTVKLSSTDITGRTPIQPAQPSTAAPPPKPPAPSAPSLQLPAPALAVLETAGHSHITYCLSVTRGCPLLGLVSKKNITSCHAPQPSPPTLRYARDKGVSSLWPDFQEGYHLLSCS